MMVRPSDEDLVNHHELFWVNTAGGPWVMRWHRDLECWQVHGDPRWILPTDAAALGWTYIGKATFSPCPTCLQSGWMTPSMGAEPTTCPTCLGARAVTGGELSAPFRRLLRAALDDQVVVLELEVDDPETSDQRRRNLETDINRLNILRGLYS